MKPCSSIRVTGFHLTRSAVATWEPSGTFVINGAERVIVSQIVRSPGVYYDKKTDKAYNSTYGTTVIPYHGAWLEYETDLNDIFNCRIDKNRKLPVTWFIKAMGAYKADNPNTWLSCIPDMTTGVVTNEQIKEVFDNDARIYTDLMKVVNKDVEEGETKIVNSRYSIVMATSKRARQLIAGDLPLVDVKEGEKPLSIAIEELNKGELKIKAESAAEEE